MTNRADNRICNLRDVDAQTNAQNSFKARVDNASGRIGVKRRADGRFQARIQAGGVPRHLGTFETADEAALAYLLAKRDLHPEANYEL